MLVDDPPKGPKRRKRATAGAPVLVIGPVLAAHLVEARIGQLLGPKAQGERTDLQPFDHDREVAKSLDKDDRTESDPAADSAARRSPHHRAAARRSLRPGSGAGFLSALASRSGATVGAVGGRRRSRQGQGRNGPSVPRRFRVCEGDEDRALAGVEVEGPQPSNGQNTGRGPPLQSAYAMKQAQPSLTANRGVLKISHP